MSRLPHGQKTPFARLVRVVWCVLLGSPSLSTRSPTTPWPKFCLVLATRACLSSPEGPLPRSRQPDTPRLPTQLPKVPPPNRLDSHTSEQFDKKTPACDLLSIANATSFCPLFCRTRLNTPRIMEGKPRRNFRIPNPRAKVPSRIRRSIQRALSHPRQIFSK